MLINPTHFAQYSEREIPKEFLSIGASFLEQKSIDKIERWHKSMFPDQVAFTKDNYADATECVSIIVSNLGSLAEVDAKRFAAVMYYDLLHNKRTISAKCLLIKELANKRINVIFSLITLMSYPNIEEQDSNQAFRQFLLEDSVKELLAVISAENIAFSFLNSMLTLFNKVPAKQFADALHVVRAVCTACHTLVDATCKAAVGRLSVDVKQHIVDRLWLVFLLSPLDINLYYAMPLVCSLEDSVFGNLPGTSLNAIRFQAARLDGQSPPSTYSKLLDTLDVKSRQQVENTFDVLIERIPSVCSSLLFYKVKKDPIVDLAVASVGQQAVGLHVPQVSKMPV